MDEGTKTLIRALLFIAINAMPIWSIYTHFRDRKIFKDVLDDLEESLLLQKGHGIWREAENRDTNSIPWFLIGCVGFFGYALTDNFFGLLVTIALWVPWFVVSSYWEYAAPIVNRTQAQKRQALRQQAQAAHFKSRASFEAPPGGDDEFFSSKAQQERREPPRQERKQETPYGFDKRHPKDAKLWAVVDDPNASDGERQAAFSAILKRNAQRKRGEDPKPASDADVIRLIGSDRK